MVKITIVALFCLASPSLSNAQESVVPSSTLPPASKLSTEHIQRNLDGQIVAAEDEKERRVCASPTGANCQFTDIAAAVVGASPGTVIVLAPGVYKQGAVLPVDRVILRGERGARLQGGPVEGKAALVIRGNGVVVEGIECSGIEVPDQNGACIRIEGQDLTVRNVYFHHNQSGVLGGVGGRVLIEDSRFSHNGYAGRAHGIYIGESVQEFIFRRNSVLDTVGEGHGVKSRAARTIIEDNVIASLDGNDSRAVDLPNGGEVLIRGNILEKGPNSANEQMIGLGLEGSLHPANNALIERNLIIFDMLRSPLGDMLSSIPQLNPGKGVVVGTQLPIGAVILRENVIVGAGATEVSEGPFNKHMPSRRVAGLPPYPHVERSMLSLALPDQ